MADGRRDDKGIKERPGGGGGDTLVVMTWDALIGREEYRYILNILKIHS